MPGLSKVVVLDPDARASRQVQLGFEREGIPTAAIAGEAASELPDDIGLVVVGGVDGRGAERIRLARSWLDERGVDAPIVFAGRGVPWQDATSAGADEVLRHPAYLRDLVTIGRLLRGLPAGRRDHIVGSLIEVTGVFTLVRALSTLSRSATLTLVRGLRRGEVRFYLGEVTSAQIGMIHGQAALHQLLLWTDARFDYHHEDVVRRQQIPLSPDELFADAERFLEGVRESSGGLSPAMVLEQDVERIQSFGAQIPTEVYGVLRMFDGHRALADVLEDSAYRVFETLRVAQRAVDAGLVRVVASQPRRPSWRPVLAIEDWLVGGAAREAAPPKPPAPLRRETGPITVRDARAAEAQQAKLSRKRRKKRRRPDPPAASAGGAASGGAGAAGGATAAAAEIDWGALVPRIVGAEVGPLAGVVPASHVSGEIDARGSGAAPRPEPSAIADEPSIVFDEAAELAEVERAAAERAAVAERAEAERRAAEARRLADERAEAERLAAAAEAERAEAERVAAEAQRLAAEARAAAEAERAEAERVAAEAQRLAAEARAEAERAEAERVAAEAERLATEARAEAERAEAERRAAEARAGAERAEAERRAAEARAEAERAEAEARAQRLADEARAAAEAERAEAERLAAAETLRLADERAEAERVAAEAERAEAEARAEAIRAVAATVSASSEPAHVTHALQLEDTKPERRAARTARAFEAVAAPMAMTDSDAITMPVAATVGAEPAPTAAEPAPTAAESAHVPGPAPAAESAPTEIADEPSDGVVRHHIATAETAPVRRRQAAPEPIEDDRPADMTGEITMPRQRPPVVIRYSEPSILVADLGALHAAVSEIAADQAAAPPTADASSPVRDAPVEEVRDAATAFSDAEEAFFRAGHKYDRPPSSPGGESFDDLDEGYRKVGFWERLRGKPNAPDKPDRTEPRSETEPKPEPKK